MSTTEIIVFVGIAALIIATQVGRRALTPRRFLVPVLAAAFVAYHYLQSVPTVGGDLDFEIALGAIGALCGVAAAYLMRVERDGQTGRLVTQAGAAYAALWIAVFGGRLAFAWGATHLWQHQIFQFSVQHEITGTAAWTAAFVFMALSMVLARTAIVAIRALTVDRPLSLRTGLES
jgi:DMSO/TMAO reductase YedYZ heme-binding membrane subunit